MNWKWVAAFTETPAQIDVWAEPIETQILPCRHLSDLIFRKDVFCDGLVGLRQLRHATIVEFHLQNGPMFLFLLSLFSGCWPTPVKLGPTAVTSRAGVT
jgi:hypothetical protein